MTMHTGTVIYTIACSK